MWNKGKKVYEDNSYMLVNGKKVEDPWWKKYQLVIISAIAILLVIFITIIVINNSKNSKCNKIENHIKEGALAYAKSKELLPTVEGLSVTLNIGDMLKENALDIAILTFKDAVATGSVKITKYKDDFVTTLDLKNCSYCSTEERYGAWSKEINKKPNKRIVDVIPYYNYYEVELYNTEWTDWMESSKVSKEKSAYDNYLPLDEKKLPTIPKLAYVNNIYQETKTRYRYRDRQWKFYKIVGDYSPLSSEQPAGYQNKDNNASIYTEWSPFSQEAPEEKPYRTITERTGYRWYYVSKSGDKIYYNHGEFLPEAPDEQYTEKSKDTVKLYSYRDQMWRWYNGTTRGYSGYYSVMPRGYNYRDDEITRLSGFSSWSDVSSINESNSYYREEETDTYSRYRIRYGITSYIILDEALTKDEFEAKVGRTIEDMANDENIKLEVTYKFIYRK